jgi:L-threonylcarbamoyladenylate synthase
MTLSTQILSCDASAIGFKGTSGQPTITSPDTLNALRTATHHLLDLRQPVAFPTETVYGLGALALDDCAASRIFTTKGRPPDNPLIVHVSSLAMLRSLLPADYEPPPAYGILMKHFWPGALTLLFPRDPAIVPSIITANHASVAIRMPSHPVARALIALANSPLAAPSANSSGKPSPTKAEHVLRDLNGKVGVILDGGVCGVGLESTVVGVDDDGNMRVLRPGGVTVEDMERVLTQETPASYPVPKVLVYRRDYFDELIEQAPTTPGMKYRHYAPAVPVILLLTSSLPLHGMTRTPVDSFLASLKERAVDASSAMSVGILTPSDSPLARHTLPAVGIEWRRYLLGPITDPAVTAQRLFDGLLTLEEAGVDLILVEEVKEEKEGLAVMNRVAKAAGESKWLQVC